jgi:hypothetical protein
LRFTIANSLCRPARAAAAGARPEGPAPASGHPSRPGPNHVRPGAATMGFAFTAS